MTFVRGFRYPGVLRGVPARTYSHLARDIPVDIHPEIQEALAHHKPVVALETALITHGLPFPTNLEVPLSLEEIVRSTGSIPATTGIIGGRVKIGLEKHELERLAERRNRPVKISRRDIAAAIATESDGGTTCSATLVFAALAGIKVFATGGLGGVHRGGERSLDISADLHELTRCPVGLVSSGVKSILDIKRTLEYLETLGVPVISYGDSKEFPAFYSRHSGHYVPWNVDDPHKAAKILYTQQQMGLQNGALIAVPIPEEYEATGTEVQKLVNQAIKESEDNGMSVSGSDVTPWLLGRIAELSGGKSLIANIALLENTALVGGRIAAEYQKLTDETSNNRLPSTPSFEPETIKEVLSSEQKVKIESQMSSPNIVVVGCAAVDITAQELSDTKTDLARHSTAPGHVRLSLGGVGRNIAEATHRILQARTSRLSSLLLAPIGGDPFGKFITRELSESGMRIDGLLELEDRSSAVCNMVLDSQGGLVGGIADMDINDRMSADSVIPRLRRYAPSIVALDGNLPPTTIKDVVAYCSDHGIKVLFEPTSIIKSTSILPSVGNALQEKLSKPPVTYCTPNLLELNKLYEAAQSEEFGFINHPSWWSVIDDLNLGSSFRMDLEQLSRTRSRTSDKALSFLLDQGSAQKAIHLLPFFQHLVIKCGGQGVLVVMCISPEDATNSAWRHERSNPTQGYVVAPGRSGKITIIQHFPALPVKSLVNVTGAGDSFTGALLAMLADEPTALYHPNTIKEAMQVAQKAAVLTLQCHLAVSPMLSKLMT